MHEHGNGSTRQRRLSVAGRIAIRRREPVTTAQVAAIVGTTTNAARMAFGRSSHQPIESIEGIHNLWSAEAAVDVYAQLQPLLGADLADEAA